MAEPSAAPAPLRWLFVLAIFCGSFLLFLVQPMVARMALPRLGGAPNVWNSAMLVYQALLLAGYAYAHALSRLPVGRQAALHLALLVVAGLSLPIALPDLAPPAPGMEALWVPWLFVLAIGPVFFVVAAQAPLMQRWFAASPSAGDPYPLYAASNLGSFAGLLAYPLLAEPLLSLKTQGLAWAIGYASLILLVGATALARRNAPSAPLAPDAASGEAKLALGWRRMALWLALSAVPSGLMLSTTTYLTTDIFAMPLLWVIPLGLYLLSFSVAFAERRAVAGAVVLLAPLVLCADGALAMLGGERPSLLAAGASLVLLFVVAVALHSRLYETRPEPARLTQFYLVMAAGGALGGLFTAIVAPLLFDWTWEHPLLLLASAALLPLGVWQGLLGRVVGQQRANSALVVLIAVVAAGSAWLWRENGIDPSWNLAELLVFVAAVTAATVLAWRRWAYVAACALLLAGLGVVTQLEVTFEGTRKRSYFGIYTVEELGTGERMLWHGTTIHGMELRDPNLGLQPTTYYGAMSGAGQVMLAAEQLYGTRARIGVVGLGVGTLASYSQPDQAWTFFEIDQAVLDYSRDGTFSYLRECAPQARVVMGDARLNLAKQRPGSFDILILDAFSSDAVPLHLVTAEAYDAYLRALAPDGLLLVHISNRFVDLEPPLSALVRRHRLAGAVRDDETPGRGAISSTWVVLTRDPDMLDALMAPHRSSWRALRPPASSVWTDDFASILPYLTWRNFL